MTTLAKSTVFPRSAIEQICEKHRIGSLKSVQYSSSGKVNPLLFLNHQYVLKVNVRDPELPKLQREAVCMRVLKEKGLPVPELLTIDTEQEIIDHDYLIMSRVEGEEIYVNWEKIPQKERKQVCFEAGEMLAAIHEVMFEGFGEIAPGEKSFDNFHSYLLSRVEKEIVGCRKLGVYRPGLLDQALHLFEKSDSIFQQVQKPHLVHNDFHLGNLLHQNGRITGVLDFEWSLAGDPEMEFRDPFTHTEGWQHFMEGYQSKRKFSDEFEAKTRLYQLQNALELSIVAHQHWDEDVQEWVRERVKGLIEET